MSLIALGASFLFLMILGMAWYSPLMFGTLWLKELGKTKADISSKEANKAMIFAFIPAVITTCAVAFFIYVSNTTSLVEALLIATFATIGFIAPALFNQVLFEGRKAGLTLINLGYSWVGIIGCALIIVLIP